MCYGLENHYQPIITASPPESSPHYHRRNGCSKGKCRTNAQRIRCGIGWLYRLDEVR